MNKAPMYLKIISLIGMLTSLLGIAIAFKVPGTVALAPLTIGLLFAVTSIIITNKKKVKCYGGYIASAIAVLGIIVTLVQQAKDPEVAVDKKQENTIDKRNEVITESDDLDDALDDLE